MRAAPEWPVLNQDIARLDVAVDHPAEALTAFSSVSPLRQ
jgi:hypothetical protein